VSLQRRFGPWAVITGASSGIGEQMARRLAAEGLSVVLVARRRDRLDRLRRELVELHPIDTRVIEADLAVAAEAVAVGTATADLDVGFVFANAGFGHKGAFHEAPIDELSRMVDVNCRGTLLLAHAFAARLVERRGGALVITSSTASFQPIPYTAAYAATKAFDSFLAEALAEELRPHGVRVLSLCPGATDTEGPRRTGVDPNETPFVMTAEAVVAATLRALVRGRAVRVVPGVTNRLNAAAMGVLPRRLGVLAAGRVMRATIDKGQRGRR
jgi:uncharacterized protein